MERRRTYKDLYVSKCKENYVLQQKIEELEKQNKILEDALKKKENPSPGKMCSVSGKKYENQIHDVVIKCYLNNRCFNTQTSDQLGGSSAKNDIECNFEKNKDVGIEIKKYNTPDWMQCSIKYNREEGWTASKKGKIPKKCSTLFETLINNINLYDGKIPPFMEKNLTHEEWLSIKKNTTQWGDVYYDIPNDTIKQLYSMKNCQYIQLSNGYGLYHLGNDICNFDVPEFIIKQQLRIRTKIHTRKNKNGFCNLSVTVACQPKNIKLLEKSKYFLDNIEKLPKNLIKFIRK